MTQRTITVNICGGCGRDMSPGVTPDKCEACGGECCFVCGRGVCGCIVAPTLCYQCADIEAVVDACMGHAGAMKAALAARSKAMKSAYRRVTK